jgi:hypothetical protein
MIPQNVKMRRGNGQSLCFGQCVSESKRIVCSVIAIVQDALKVASASAPKKGVKPFEQAQHDLVEFTERHQIVRFPFCVILKYHIHSEKSLGNICEKMENAQKKDKDAERLTESVKLVFFKVLPPLLILMISYLFTPY